MMKWFLTALAILLSVSAADAQCTGQTASGYFCGNSKGSQAPFAAAAPSAQFDAAWGQLQGTVLARGPSGWSETATPILGASGTLGSLTFGNATSGLVTLEPVTGALGTVTASLPANSGTIAETNFAQAFTALQTFSNSDLALAGNSTGITTFASANSSATNYTITFPAATGTVALTSGANVASVSNSDGSLTISPTTGNVVASLNVAHANTFTALQTFDNSDIALLGTSTGSTTFTSANSGASNFTATIPANTGTFAELNLAQTFSAVQSFNSTDLVLKGSSSGTTTLNAAATAGTTTATLPDNTGTIAETNFAQTYSALQTFNTGDLAINGGTATAGLATVTSGGVVSSETNATVAQGGTGQTSLTANAFLTGNATSGINQVAITGLVVGNGASAPTAYGGCSLVSNEFLTALSASGICSQAQPSVSNISGFGTGVASALGQNTNTASGLIVPSGLSSVTCSNSLVITSAGLPGLGVCPGAASSVQAGAGGTTITSGTNGGLLWDNGGTLYASAALTGLVLGNGTSAPTTVSYTGTTSWTPADASGATLTFTSVTAKYQVVNNIVTAWFTLTYPSTASSAHAEISGLPINLPSTYSSMQCMVNYNNGTPGTMWLQGNSGDFFILSSGGNFVLNSTLSLGIMTGTCAYPNT